MSIAAEFLKELILEASVTRRYLETVPFDKAGYKPAETSETLGRLAIHIAEVLAWWRSCLQDTELDFIDFEPRQINSTKELLAYFDQLLEEAKNALENAKDEDFGEEWSMRHGDVIYFTLPKSQVARIFCMNHWIHHRAQLGVYFRLLGIAVPATYGPSADDEMVLLTKTY